VTGGPRVSVVIPNWNGGRWLGPCLAALKGQRFRDFEVLVVDNGSTDDSRRIVEESGVNVRWIGLPRNEGFAAAVNAGIREASGEFVALLNNDTEAEPGWLKALVEGLDGRPEFASAASRMLDAGDRGRIDGAGDAMHWDGSPTKIGAGEPNDGRFDREREVFGACAGAALYRRSLFEEIGLFEESFFAYCEDVDLNFRAQLAGHRCLYLPDAIIYHVGGGTSGGNSDFALRLYTRNRLLMIARNYPWRYLWTKLPLVARAQYRLLRWAWNERRLGVVLRAYGDFLAHLPRALAARRAIHAHRRVALADLNRVIGG
jgi:GT2 family glycosyltransferase